jgi:hypothetical protein
MIGFLDPDPHSECGSGSGRVKSAEIEGKNEAKIQIIHHKSYSSVLKDI